MAHTKHSPSESSPHGPENLVKADLKFAILGDTESIDAHDGSLNPTYVAKAKILNDALREIGMGRYQVGLLWTLVSVPYLSVTPLFSGTFLSSPVLAGCRMCPYYSPCVSHPAQYHFDSDNLWPVIRFSTVTAATPIHQSFPIVDCHRSYPYARGQRICFPRSLPQARAERWFTCRCRCFWCWIRYLGTQVRFL